MKKVATIFFGFTVMIVLSSFFSLFFGESFSEKRKMACKITKKIGEKLKHEYGLRFLGISEEAFDGKYRRIGVELDYKKGVLSKNEGRTLVLKCREHVLNAFNSCPEFKQYMADYPFTGYNIIVNIYVHYPTGHSIYYPDIAIFSFYDDLLHYDTYIPEKENGFYTSEEETLEEAIRLSQEYVQGKASGGSAIETKNVPKIPSGSARG